MNAETGGRKLGSEFATAMISLVGVALLVIYPIGFITLWIQLATFFLLDYSEALYATSLVPVNEVVAKSISSIPWGLSSIFSLGIALTVWGWLRNRHRDKGWKWLLLISLIFLLAGFIALVAFWLYSGHPVGVFGYSYQTSWSRLFLGIFFCSSVIGGVVGGATLYYARSFYEHAWRFIGGLSVAYLGTAVATTCIVGMTFPTLPTIDIYMSSNKEGSNKEGSILRSVLLSHSEQTWYIAVPGYYDPSQHQSTGCVVAIPDTKVDGVVAPSSTYPISQEVKLHPQRIIKDSYMTQDISQLIDKFQYCQAALGEVVGTSVLSK